MTTHFITAEIDAQESAWVLHEKIEAELHQQGEPLRWAITRVEDQKVQVEAVVSTEPAQPS